MSGINSLIPVYAGGLQIKRSLDLGTTPLVIASKRAQLYGGWIANLGTVNLFIKLYNSLAPIVGTTTPVITFPMPGSTSNSIAAILGAGAQGIEFLTGISAACTTGLADNDVGAPVASTMVVNFFYCDRIQP